MAPSKKKDPHVEMEKQISELDKRIAALEISVEHNGKTIESYAGQLHSLDKTLQRVSEKVFDGFGEKMDGIERKIDQNKKDNDTTHREIKKGLSSMMKFWGMSMVLIFVALVTILGSIWFQDRSTNEVGKNASVNIAESATK